MANRKIAHAVRVALMTAGAAGAGLYVPSVAAQEALEEIVVTGSRIARRDAVAESPIFTVDQESMRVSGFVTVEQYLNTLPQIIPSLSSQSNNPSSLGRAFIDLRGLGTNRNLVLIDGRRGMGSTAGGVVDVNTIPTALIERVEVITGGAASTYGPDAIAGVVNFIMKKSFDGVALDASYRITEEGDGEEWSADATFGGDFADGRGSAVFNASYFDRQAMYKGARKFSAQASSESATHPGGFWAPGTNAPSQAAVDAVFGPNTCNNDGLFGFNPDGTPFCHGIANNPNRNIAGFTGPDSWVAQFVAPDRFSYNFEPENILVMPMERWSLFNRFELDVNDNFKPYAQGQYTNYNALQELAATPAAGGTGFTVPVTNPFLSPQIQSLLASRPDPNAPFSLGKRFNTLGGRTGYNTHDVWQLTMGATGDIVAGWAYDTYASWGRSVQNETQGGNVRRDRTQLLLNDPLGGNNANCPGGLNLFGTAPISAACAAYISLEAKNLTTVEQGIWEGVVTGDLFELPAGMVQSAFGASYRHLDYDFRPDGGLQPGLVAGFNQQLPTSGRLWFTDLFTEVVLPIVTDAAWAQNLSLTAGFRYTDNNRFDSENTYKLTGDWTVNDQFRARAGYQRAVRSPTITELFAPQLNNFPTFTNQDPCNTSGPNANNAEWGRLGPNGAQVAALCAQQSAVAGGPAYFQPFGQATGIVGGNPDLGPETADSWTAGFVVTPAFQNPMLERLTFSIDYWSIDLEDVIAAVGASTIVQRCYNRDGANPTFNPNNQWCQLFNREPSNGGVIDLTQLSQNQAFIETSGVDFTLDWGIGVGPGDLAFNVVTTWVEKFETQTTTVDPVYDFAGTVSSDTGGSSPEWKTNITTSYTLSDWQIQMVNRYIDGMDHANTVTGGSPLSNTGTDSTWYTDVSVRYDLTETFNIRAGIQNLANQQPRLYTPNVQANTDPSLYDVLGRRFFVGVNWRM
jgi:iron complex outermembrane recepter protein